MNRMLPASANVTTSLNKLTNPIETIKNRSPHYKEYSLSVNGLRAIGAIKKPRERSDHDMNTSTRSDGYRPIGEEHQPRNTRNNQIHVR